MFDTYTMWRVARVFFDEPTEMHGLREIGRGADLSHTALDTHLDRLQEAEVIEEQEEKRKDSTFSTYRARHDADAYRFYKRLDMLARIHETGLVDRLEQVFAPDCIVLFGSAARGEDVSDSDVDLFIQAQEQDCDLSSFEDAFHRDIQLHITDDITDYPEELQRNIANGITLTGFLDVIP